MLRGTWYNVFAHKIKNLSMQILLSLSMIPFISTKYNTVLDIVLVVLAKALKYFGFSTQIPIWYANTSIFRSKACARYSNDALDKAVSVAYFYSQL